MKMRLGLFFIVATLVLGACQRSSVPAVSEAKEAEPSLFFEGFRARGTEGGATLWQAQAVRARVFQGDQKAFGEDVTIIYFQNGRRVSTATALRAEIDMAGYDFKASGQVVVKGANGVVLRTEYLRWDHKRQRAVSDSKVRVERKDTVLTGEGLIADRTLEDVQVLRNVQVEATSVQSLRELGEGARP